MSSTPRQTAKDTLVRFWDALDALEATHRSYRLAGGDVRERMRDEVKKLVGGSYEGCVGRLRGSLGIKCTFSAPFPDFNPFARAVNLTICFPWSDARQTSASRLMSLISGSMVSCDEDETLCQILCTRLRILQMPRLTNLDVSLSRGV